jgi:hypothetical protein
MASCLKITLFSILGFIAFCVLSAIYVALFVRYSFESEYAFGINLKEEIMNYQRASPAIDAKIVKCLFFSRIVVINAPRSILTKLTLKDGRKLSDEQYKHAMERINTACSSNESNDAVVDFVTCFYKFQTKESGGKLVFRLEEWEEKFIKDNSKVIKDIGENAFRFYTDDVVKYLNGENVSISESASTSFIALLTARYANFALL